MPVLICLAWVAATPATLAAAWYQVVGFRADASAVLAASDSRAPVERGHELAVLFVMCGMAPLLLLAAASARRWFARWSALSVALVTMTAVDLLAVVVSGSYWHAYLVPLVPDVALLAALAASTGPPARTLTRFVAALAAVATLAAYAGFTHDRLSPPPRRGSGRSARRSPPSPAATTRSSASTAAPSSSRRRGPPPYLHLWSLPMRTLDPDQAELRSLLNGDTAPTWVVAVLPLNSWHIDADGRLRRLLVERYRLVSIACGPMVWLRRDVHRSTPPLHCT